VVAAHPSVQNASIQKNTQGDSQFEIARILQVDLSIISRDVYYLRQQSKENVKRYIDERLPEEYEKCLVGLNAITKEAWNTAQSAEDKRYICQYHTIGHGRYLSLLFILPYLRT
jgi:hypothetical protein